MSSDDTISRQAAIDDIRTMIPKDARLDIKWVEMWLMQLPSAQPERKSVIYSGDGYADGHMVYDLAECPECGYEYEESDMSWGEPYCPHCGQSLNWDTEGDWKWMI